MLWGMKSNAVKKGNDWILNGSKHFISGPCLPDFAIVFALQQVRIKQIGGQEKG